MDGAWKTTLDGWKELGLFGLIVDIGVEGVAFREDATRGNIPLLDTCKIRTSVCPMNFLFK